MADHISTPLKHLQFSAIPDSFPYNSPRGGPSPELKPRVNRNSFVTMMKEQLKSVQKEFEKIEVERETSKQSSDFGLILNVESEPGYPLSYESLEDLRAGICLLNLRHEMSTQGEVTKAAIFVPFGKLGIIQKKIEDYAIKDNKNKLGEITGPKNSALFNNINSIAVAALDALWTDFEKLPEENEQFWFELWIRRDSQKDWLKQLLDECEKLDIEVPDQILTFPDHIVIIAHGTRNQLESSLDLLNCLSEARRARPCSVGLSDLSDLEQEEWIDDALERILWPDEEAPAVCLLDTGVNRGHALIEPLLSSEDMDTVFGDEDTADELNPSKAHGTPMAGLAAFGDLRTLMLSSETWQQIHRLESVKLIKSSTPHKPENYGYVTQQAIYNRDAANSQRARVFCMAITSNETPNTFGNPSSWSTALDIVASGAGESEQRGRIILVSAGNTDNHDGTFSYPQTLEQNPIEDPAHAWNVITVGAVTNRTIIEEDDDEAKRCNPVAPSHGLSPFTRTSHAWTEGRKDWPIKPDIVMEGGNLAQHRELQDDYPHFHSLKPLTTTSNFRSAPPIRSMDATSAATAQASRIAAQILASYPDLNPETVRGLLVHSARWPQQLLDREGIDPHASGQTENVKSLMRSYGFGIVDEERALKSLNNEATFLTEGNLFPYRKTSSGIGLNECHLISLPWPKQLLQENDAVTCTLRVTLSYFIEPNPGTRGFESGKKYRYASHLIGIKPKHSNQTLEEFRSRLHAEEEKTGQDPDTDPGWAVGGNTRKKAGSLVQDVWKGSAADLALMDSIAIYPRAKGWWALRKFDENRIEHNCHERSVPYSLIISIETEADLPIYQEVNAAINEVQTNISSPSEESVEFDLFDKGQ